MDSLILNEYQRDELVSILKLPPNHKMIGRARHGRGHSSHGELWDIGESFNKDGIYSDPDKLELIVNKKYKSDDDFIAEVSFKFLRYIWTRGFNYINYAIPIEDFSITLNYILYLKKGYSIFTGVEIDDNYLDADFIKAALRGPNSVTSYIHDKDEYDKLIECKKNELIEQMTELLSAINIPVSD